MMAINQKGNIFSFLIFLILLITTIGFGWVWYQGHEELVSKWLKQGKASKDRGYMTYEEYLRKKERTKTVTELKSKIHNLIENSKKRSDY